MMEVHALLAIFIAVAITSLLAAQPITAQVVDDTVYYHPGKNPATRQPRTPGAGGRFATLSNWAVVPQTNPGETLPVWTAPSSTIVIPSATPPSAPTTHALAFVNVSRCAWTAFAENRRMMGRPC